MILAVPRPPDGLLRNQTRKPFVQPKRRVPMHCGQSKGRGQHQVRSVRLQQICRTDIGLESSGDERDHIHQSLSGFAAFRCEIADFFQG